MYESIEHSCRVCHQLSAGSKECTDQNGGCELDDECDSSDACGASGMLESYNGLPGELVLT